MRRVSSRVIAIAVTSMLMTSVLAASPAIADEAQDIIDRVDAILNVGSGTTGLYVKEVGGSVIAGKNENAAFEPASTIKVLAHLYAHDQVEAGNATFGTQVTAYPAEPPGDSCPDTAATGTERLDFSVSKMMRVSDNPATRAQFEFWTLPTLNTYATGLGAGQTNLQNIIGCQVPNIATVDDNTTSLADLGILYEGVADSSIISGAIRDSFFNLMSGRQQAESFGGDFTGIWPKLLTMVDQESVGMPTELVADFKAAMTANHKGGSYGKCLDNACASLKEWYSFAGWAQFPTCEDRTFSSRSYVWGIYIDGAIDSTASAALGLAAAEPLREQMNKALAGWGACYPPDVEVSTTPAAVPGGQAGFFNADDLANNGGAITVNVSATDDSGVIDLLCTDNNVATPVGNQAGSDPRTGSFGLVTDETHNIECEATDGMTPSNTGASDTSNNTATVMIDATPPTVVCEATPTFILNGPGGEVHATVSDALSGPLNIDVSAPVDASSAGAKTVALTGHDLAGNSTTVDCSYIVAYKLLGPFEPLPQEAVKAGSKVPVKFALADANDVRIPDSEAQALADACDVQIFFTAGDPFPNCVEYKAGPNRFEFLLKTPKSTAGPHDITIKVFDGVVVINEHSSSVELT